MFTFTERPDSRQSSANPPTYTLRYTASGEQDDLFVQSYALGATPVYVSTPFGTMYRQDVKIDPDGFGIYTVTVPYAKGTQETGSWTFSFDTTGATVHITTAKEHIASYPDGSPSDPHKCAISVDKDGRPQGAEIIIPTLKLSVQFSHPQGVVDVAFAKLLNNVTGRTNSAPFIGFETGELLFLGGVGSDGREAPAQVTYQFSALANDSSVSYGDITGIVKAGHHLAWVEFKDEVEDGEAATQPKRVHIERVYDAVNYASVFGWS